MKILILTLAAVLPLCAQAPEHVHRAADIAHEIRDSGLDPAACYRARDISFHKEDLRFHLTDGYLIFGKPVAGAITSAVFVAAPETGDGEVILFPPTRSERSSLAGFTETPNLDEHIRSAVFLFTDNTAADLLEQLKANEARLEPDKGALIASEWGSVVRNLAGSIDNRIIYDRISGAAREWGIFYSIVTGVKLGNFDLVFDPQAREQITVGQVAHRDGGAWFNTWTSFEARSFRTGRRKPFESRLRVSDFRIEANIGENLRLSAVTRMRVSGKGEPVPIIPFQISRRMEVTKVLANGAPAEVHSREALRSDLIRSDVNSVVLVTLPQPLKGGEDVELELHHAGDVITPSGNGVFFVGARTNWYPNHETNFATYDITFRYPNALDLVANGDVVEDRLDGEYRVTRRRTASPIRFAGFNLGSYTQATAKSGEYTVEVYANRSVENTLRRQEQVIVVPQPRWTTGMPREVLTIPTPPPNAFARMQDLATEVATALDFYSANFGKAPMKTLTVSPIPGAFGQGFPGLLYISTLSYLNPHERPAGARTQTEEVFFSELLLSHETAHQWWGNVVASSSAQDDWIMEALANYSALMLLERRRGRRALDDVLAEYKRHLLEDTAAGKPLDAAGPIVWGTRLNTSQTPNAWRIITYEKGSWILHMLRAQFGDDRFLQFLRELATRYRFRQISTDDFRELAREFVPKELPDKSLDLFFDQWVYGTGIPVLRFDHTVRGKAPAVKVRGTLKQSGVDEDFSTLVPVEIQLPGKRSLVRWVQSSSETVAVNLDTKVAPSRVAMDPNNVILRR